MKSKQRAQLSGRIVVMAGGFAPVGGVETFAHSLVLALRDRCISAPVICWGRQNVLLGDIMAAGIPVRRTGFRWGCRWGLPDRLLLALRRREIRDSALVVFPKLLRSDVHLAIGRMRQASGGPRSLLITPYRPAEMWAASPPGPELLNSFDTIITQSPAFAADLRQFGYEGTVTQLPLIPPRCESTTPFPAGPFRIGFLGRLVPDKRVDYLLDVLAVARRTRDIRLEIFGDGGLRDHLEARTQELGLLRYTTFHGRIGRDRLSSAIDSCTLFAFPSRTEGQCLAALEVLSRGRPIVATPVGLFPEMLDDRRLGRIAPGNNPSEFAEAILNALSEVETFCLTAPIVQGSYANHFRRDSVIEGYIGVITELASNMRGVPAK